MNHAGALGDAGDPNLLAVQRHATRVELGKGVRGHDAAGGIVPAFGLQLVHGGRHPGPNAIHGQLHANDARYS